MKKLGVELLFLSLTAYLGLQVVECQSSSFCGVYPSAHPSARKVLVPSVRINLYCAVKSFKPTESNGGPPDTIFWEINGSGRYNSTVSLDTKYIQQGIEIPSSKCYLDDNYCNTTMSFLGSIANNNTVVRCGGSSRSENCLLMQWSAKTTLKIQGLLSGPPNLHAVQKQETTNAAALILLTWDPPFSLDGKELTAILNYTVYLNDRFIANTTATYYTLAACDDQNITLSVAAWNVVGEGEKTYYFLTADVQNLDTLTNVTVYSMDDTSVSGAVCVACSYRNNSHSQGCHAQILNENTTTSTSFNNIRSTNPALHTGEIFTCQSGLSLGQYTVIVTEIYCSGAMAAIQVIESTTIIDTANNITDTFDLTVCAHSDTFDLTVLTVIFGVVMVITILTLVVVTCAFITLRRRKHSGPQTTHSDVYDVSVLYDQVRKGAPPSPQQVELNSAPYKIQPKGPDPDHIGMKFETCVAYGL